MNPLRQCPRCGVAAQPANAFCGHCGSPLSFPRQTTSWRPIVYVLCGIVALSIAFSIVAVFTYKPQQVPPRQLVSDSTKLTAAAPPSAPSPSDAVFDTPTARFNQGKAYANSEIHSHLEQSEALLGTVPKDAKEYREAQALLKKVRERKTGAMREQLKSNYEGVVSAANPHLNYIDSKLTKAKGGYALWATHEYFTQYSLSIGDDAKVISAWIDANRSDLREAGVVRVGLMGRGGYASWSYFDLK